LAGGFFAPGVFAPGLFVPGVFVPGFFAPGRGVGREAAPRPRPRAPPFAMRSG